EHGQLRKIGPAPEVIDEYLGEVFAERRHEDEEQGGPRWGSGEARVIDVEILDAGGNSVERVRTGDAVTFRLRDEGAQPVAQPVFGLAIHRLDGVEVTGPNTREAGAVPDAIDGPGTVDLHVDRLMLVPGTYDLSTSIHNYTLSHPYDVHSRFLRFDVEHGTPATEFGVMALGGDWQVPGLGRRIAEPSGRERDA